MSRELAICTDTGPALRVLPLSALVSTWTIDPALVVNVVPPLTLDSRTCVEPDGPRTTPNPLAPPNPRPETALPRTSTLPASTLSAVPEPPTPTPMAATAESLKATVPPFETPTP